MSNVIELKRKAPKPSYTMIVCDECEGNDWRIIGVDMTQLDDIMITIFQCCGCGSEVPAAIIWPEVDE